MTYETIEQTVNLLCEKFGLAVNKVGELMPQARLYEIISMSLSILFCATIIAIAVSMYIRQKHYDIDRTGEFDATDHVGKTVFMWVSCGIGGTIIVYCVDSLISWIACPTMAFIRYVANMVSGS